MFLSGAAMTNRIDSTVIMQGDVELGDGNEILPHSILIGPLRLGDNNLIGPFVTIGSPPADTRHRDYDGRDARIDIGSENIIREYTAIQKPRYRSTTSIGNRCFLMQNVAVQHDAMLQDDVVVTAMVAMGGVASVLRGANLALGCTIHQFSVLGHYCIAAMGAPVLKNIPPFTRYIPQRPLSVNEYAVKKFGFEEHADEISDYVLRRVPPVSPVLASIVSEFDALHRESGRELV
jgi:UDP-N-acetylglucosamine acyltransferase